MVEAKEVTEQRVNRSLGKGEPRYLYSNGSDLLYTKITLAEWLSYHVKPLKC